MLNVLFIIACITYGTGLGWLGTRTAAAWWEYPLLLTWPVTLPLAAALHRWQWAGSCLRPAHLRWYQRVPRADRRKHLG